MAPLSVGLLVASAWVLLEPVGPHMPAALLVAATLLFMLRTKQSPMWPIAAGAVAGALGWV